MQLNFQRNTCPSATTFSPTFMQTQTLLAHWYEQEVVSC